MLGVSIAVDFGIGGEYVTRLLDQAACLRGLPPRRSAPTTGRSSSAGHDRPAPPPLALAVACERSPGFAWRVRIKAYSPATPLRGGLIRDGVSPRPRGLVALQAQVDRHLPALSFDGEPGLREVAHPSTGPASSSSGAMGRQVCFESSKLRQRFALRGDILLFGQIAQACVRASCRA